MNHVHHNEIGKYFLKQFWKAPLYHKNEFSNLILILNDRFNKTKQRYDM